MHATQSGVCNCSSDAASASSSPLSAGQSLPAVLQRPKTISEKAVLPRVASNKSEIIPFDSDNNKLSLDPASDTDDRQRRETRDERGRANDLMDGWKDGRDCCPLPSHLPPSLLQLDLPAVPLSPVPPPPRLPSLRSVTEILQREFSVN